jgi:siroheme synthase (precorrin-2 oxidase/ferrochelatase)
MPELTPAAQAALDAVEDDDLLREIAEHCRRRGIPVEYAPDVTAIVAACYPNGAL